MNSVTCKVIQDLLPIYNDGLASEDTIALVEKHLHECPNCRKELGFIKTEIDDTSSMLTEREDENMIRAFAKRIKRRQVIIALVAMVIAAGLTFVGMKLIHDANRPDINGNEMIYSLGTTEDGTLVNIEQHVINGVLLSKESEQAYISVPVNNKKMEQCHVRMLKDGILLDDAMVAVSDARYVTYCVENIKDKETGLYILEFYDMHDDINQIKWFKIE